MEYFEKMDWWSILCKQKFYSQIINPLSQLRTDTALLIISMKLLMWDPSESDSDPKTELYRRAKEFQFDVEASGVGTVHILQANVLIALYEFTHALYPAAFLSIGKCARFGVAFGFDQIGGQGQSWMEIEETKRVWWAVLILDRYFMNISILRDMLTMIGSLLLEIQLEA